MILQALVEYFKRLEDEGDVDPPGYQKMEIHFLIEIDRLGRFVGLQDTSDKLGSGSSYRTFCVPKERARTGSKSWKIANLLWERIDYVLGVPKSDSEKDVEAAKHQFQTFCSEVGHLHRVYPEDEEITAVNQFLSARDFSGVQAHPSWSDCQKIPGCRVSFRVQGFNRLICQNEKVQAFVAELDSSSESSEGESSSKKTAVEGLCLITGQRGQIERVHPRTRIHGGNSCGKLVGFQKKSGYDSYGKEQSFNSPISKKAAFQYAQVLNRLLSSQSKFKFSLGEDTVVFWSEARNDFEDILSAIINEPGKENRELSAVALRALYQSPQTGQRPREEDLTRFYVLGLSPNVARISVRFWYAGTVGETVRNLKMHFDDLDIIHGAKKHEHLSVFRLLVSTAPQGKSKNILANLAGEMMRSILEGTPYPRSLLGALIRRCRAEQGAKDKNTGKLLDNVTFPRASLIKAILNREARYFHTGEKEVSMALDYENTNIGYRLGRLFAVLEKIQEEASPRLNATIRDRFYGAASGTPVTAFPHLLKLKNHHVSKLENKGRAVNLERLIAEIMIGINDFPTHLAMPEQGRFAVGYYHQRQAFYTKTQEKE